MKDMRRKHNDKSKKHQDKEKVVDSPDDNYFLKNIYSFILIVTMPNLVMVLNYIVRKCHSSLFEFFSHFQRKPTIEVFLNIWLKDELDIKFGISIILGYCIFAIILMIFVPGKIKKGSITPSGNVPLYKDNGFYCYLLTLVTLCLTSYFLRHWSSISISIIYHKFPSILACLSIFSLGFCLILYFKGVYFPSCPDKSRTGYFFFDYFWGIELHPRIKNIDIKVFTNCRFGITVWAVLILCYTKYALENGGLQNGIIVNVVLQMCYITKFFWWEAGYYTTMDMNVDHAGFYICWGCIVFLPSLFTLSTDHMTTQSTSMPNIFYVGILVIGLLSLTLNYWADYQKQVVRNSDGKCMIWNKPAKIIEAKYVDLNGEIKTNILIISGFWGIARHFHYFPELLLGFCWCAASGFDYLLPFSYFIFLLILLLHRVKRDDLKCTLKYGTYYKEYKTLVPWKIVPYIY